MKGTGCATESKASRRLVKVRREARGSITPERRAERFVSVSLAGFRPLARRRMMVRQREGALRQIGWYREQASSQARLAFYYP